MNQKYLGIILIITAIILASFVYMVKSEHEAFVQSYINEKGTCYLEDGTCLHYENSTAYSIGWAVAGALILLGIYLRFIDNSHKIITEHQIKVSSALEKVIKKENEKDEFKAYLAGFNEEEQNILKAIKEQDGIKQSTLRFRTNISKTKLSLILKELENRNVVSRKESGKTKEVYLIKKF